MKRVIAGLLIAASSAVAQLLKATLAGFRQLVARGAAAKARVWIRMPPALGFSSVPL